MAKLSPLASVSATREVLEQFGLATKKTLGQHFLISDGVVAKICETAGITSEDTLLEVGPGIGTLTLALLQKGKNVVALERDRDLIPVLNHTCEAYKEKLALINQDALTVTQDQIAKASPSFPNRFVANLPYAVAATLVLDFFENFPALDSATIMVQSEVARRMSARPKTKDYGAYSIKLSLYAQPVDQFTVGAQNFFPPPRVESTVIRLDRKTLTDGSGIPISVEILKAAAFMADAAFANRRKTISNSFKTYFAQENIAITPEQISEILKSALIDPKTRGETLSTEDFLNLAKAYKCCGG